MRVERNGPGWKVITRRAGSSTSAIEEITCTKLIVATGITSKPKPVPWDLSRFEGTSFHAIEVGQRQHELLNDKVQHVTVVGGHKSALEAVGACAQAGKKVEWLIRQEGGGPTWMMPARNPDGSSLAKLSTLVSGASISLPFACKFSKYILLNLSKKNAEKINIIFFIKN